MKLKTIAVTICLLASGLLTGCGMTHHFTNPFDGQQTLPPANVNRDDIQYVPAGPEEELPNLKRALEQYQLEQQGETPPE